MSDLAQRYGSPHRLRRPLLVTLTVLVAAAGLAWLVWAIAFNGNPQVTSELVSYDVAPGEHRVDARFTVVRREASVKSSCLLRAYASDHAVVGEDNVTVGPGAQLSRTLDAPVRTERRATSLELVGCTAAGQPQPR
ncbi:MAG: DUF4307 domain-containing protein [Nocardioides sp.]